MKPTPFQVMVFGLLTGITSIGIAMLAHHVGFPLSEIAREGLVLGGMASLLGGVAGARFMPVEEKKP